MKNLKFNVTENGLEITMTKTIKNYQSTGFEKEETVEERNNRRGYICDLIGSFSPRIIASLTRRMEAMEENLMNHIDDCTGHNGKVISWKRKDGTIGTFHINDFTVIQETISMLQRGEFWRFINDVHSVTQVIEGLINDTEQDHSDSGQFRYSELSHILTKFHSR
jgi:hypothetical protein